MALAKVTLEKENKQYCGSAARPVGTALALVGSANESRQQNHSKDPGADTVQLWAIPFQRVPANQKKTLTRVAGTAPV